jgi:3-phosphoshikimate 1-carboxyvinyltransferase
MDREIEGGKPLRGRLVVPGDKSISHRAVLLGSIAQGVSSIGALSSAVDVKRTVSAMQTAGIPIREEGGKTVIEGKGITGFERMRRSEPLVIDCGNSGTTARLCAGLFGGAGFPARLSGDSSLMKRPMNRVVEPLSGIGVRITSRDGYLPVEIQGGHPAPFDYTVPVASAQVKTAFLLAALFIAGSSTVTEPVQTRDHTERMLVLMDADVRMRSTLQGNSIMVNGRRELSPLLIDVPGDISSAVFFIAAALVSRSSELVIRNVLLNPTRSLIIELFRRMGGDIRVEAAGDFPEPYGHVHVRSSSLRGVSVGGIEIPLLIDEIPALAAAACFAKGKTVIRGAAELRVKESDRIAGVADMIRRFGGKVEELDDGLVITGGARLAGARIACFGDHRLAMAAAAMGVNIRGTTVIEGAESVDISFPGFFDLLDAVTAPGPEK